MVLHAEISAALEAEPLETRIDKVVCRACKGCDARASQQFLVVAHVILHVEFQAASQPLRQACLQKMLHAAG